MSSEQTAKKQREGISIRLSWMHLCIVLVLALAICIVLWKPWQAEAARTIKVKGEATLKRVPDSFVFNASFEETTLEAATEKSNSVVAAIKALGVGEAGIQTNTSSYDKYPITGGEPTGKTYNVTVTVALEDKDLAQKVQDYLVTQNVTGQISPQVSFTKETQKQLRDEASSKAIEDARRRAEQMARDLGAKLGKVVNVNESTSGDVYPIAAYSSDSVSSRTGLTINAGESDFPYSVEVEFQIR